MVCQVECVHDIQVWTTSNQNGINDFFFLFDFSHPWIHFKLLKLWYFPKNIYIMWNQWIIHWCKLGVYSIASILNATKNIVHNVVLWNSCAIIKAIYSFNRLKRTNEIYTNCPHTLSIKIDCESTKGASYQMLCINRIWIHHCYQMTFRCNLTFNFLLSFSLSNFDNSI